MSVGKQLPADDEIHRFVDGELSGEARRRMLERLETDPDVVARVHDYRTVNDALKHAFDGVRPPPNRRTRPARGVNLRRAAAAALLFLPIGFVAGWMAQSAGGSGHKALASLEDGISLPLQGTQRLNTVLHIDVDDERSLSKVLDRAEAILDAYDKQGIQVEVVANASGLNLLREGGSPVAERVKAMMQAHQNLTFVACMNAIKRFQEKGIDVQLIGRTHSGETAIDHIVQRLQEGWTYIKI